jgi:DNA-directed RNA polymerase specialized sigma subunit
MEDRKQRMIELRKKGMSYQSIGKLMDISRQRVHQIISEYHQLPTDSSNENNWYIKLKKLII